MLSGIHKCLLLKIEIVSDHTNHTLLESYTVQQSLQKSNYTNTLDEIIMWAMVDLVFKVL